MTRTAAVCKARSWRNAAWSLTSFDYFNVDDKERDADTDGRRLQGQVMAQRRVVDILVTQRQGEHPAQQGDNVMLDLAPLPGVIKPARRRSGQSQPPVGLAKQHNAAVAGDLATAKISRHTTLTTGWKLNLKRSTIRHRRSPCYVHSKQLNYNTLLEFGGTFS